MIQNIPVKITDHPTPAGQHQRTVEVYIGFQFFLIEHMRDGEFCTTGIKHKPINDDTYPIIDSIWEWVDANEKEILQLRDGDTIPLDLPKDINLTKEEKQARQYAKQQKELFNQNVKKLRQAPVAGKPRRRPSPPSI